MRQDGEGAALVALLRATARWRDVVGEVVVWGVRTRPLNRLKDAWFDMEVCAVDEAD